MLINKYELMIITYSTYSEENKEKVVSFVNETLKSLGAPEVKIERMGDRKLAYPINKQESGYYAVFYFSLDSSKLKDITSKFGIKEEILRYMVIKDEKEKVMAKIKARDDLRAHHKEIKRKKIEKEQQLTENLEIKEIE